jgi:hypothetical protein
VSHPWTAMVNDGTLLCGLKYRLTIRKRQWLQSLWRKWLHWYHQRENQEETKQRIRFYWRIWFGTVRVRTRHRTRETTIGPYNGMESQRHLGN